MGTPPGELHGSRVHHQLWGDILKYIPAVLLPRLTGIITVPIITHLFRPELYGAYALVLANVAVLNSATLTGIGSSLLRFLPEYENDPEGERKLLSTLFTTAMAICVGVSVVGLVVLFLLSPHYRPHYTQLMMVGLLLYCGNGIFNLVAQMLRSARKPGLFSTIQLVSGYGGLAFGLMLVLVFKVGIQGLLIGSVVAALLGAGLGWRAAMGGRTIRFSGFSPEVLKHVLWFAFFVSIGNAAFWLLSYSDRWLIQRFQGTDAVGLYSIGYDLTGRTTMLFVSTFGLALQPLSISTWEASGREATERFLAASTRMYLLIMLPATVGLSVLAKPLVGALAAPAYARGADVVPFIAVALFLFGLLDIAGRGLTLNKRPDLEARNFLFAGLANVGLNLMLIPRFGIVGAAFSSLMGYLVLFALHVRSVRSFVTWHFPWASFARIGIACALMAGGVMWLDRVLPEVHRIARLGLLAGSGAVIFAAVLFALREVTPSSLRQFHAPIAPGLGGENGA